MNAPQCTPRSPATQRVGAVSRRSRVPEQYATLCLLKLRVPLDKLFRAATGETHRHAAVFVVPLDANDGSHTEARMTNLPSQHGIAIAAASRQFPPWIHEPCQPARWEFPQESVRAGKRAIAAHCRRCAGTRTASE